MIFLFYVYLNGERHLAVNLSELSTIQYFKDIGLTGPTTYTARLDLKTAINATYSKSVSRMSSRDVDMTQQSHDLAIEKYNAHMVDMDLKKYTIDKQHAK